MIKRNTLAAAILAASTGVLASCGSPNGGDGAESETSIQLPTFVGPSTPYGEALQEFAEQVEEDTEGRVSVEIFWDGSLVSGEEILSAVESGRVGMGYINNSYNPTELPLSQLVAIPFQTDSTVASQEAWNGLLESDEDFAQEWERNGVVNLGIQSVTPMIMAGTDEPSGLEWLENKSIRATSYTAQAVQAAGGSSVGLTINELYESMERGVIDGYTSMNLGTIPSLSLQEVTPHIVDPGLGIYSTVSLIVNADVFEGLSEDDQEALSQAGVDLGETYLEVVDRVEDEACAEILDDGGSVTVWDDAEVNRWQELVGDDLMDSWQETVSGQGQDGEAFSSAYSEALAQSDDSDEGALERCASQ